MNTLYYQSKRDGDAVGCRLAKAVVCKKKCLMLEMKGKCNVIRRASSALYHHPHIYIIQYAYFSTVCTSHRYTNDISSISMALVF